MQINRGQTGRLLLSRDLKRVINFPSCRYYEVYYSANCLINYYLAKCNDFLANPSACIPEDVPPSHPQPFND